MMMVAMEIKEWREIKTKEGMNMNKLKVLEQN